ncbi:ubiquitin carboxyl-terminal hydrolase 1-like [Uloborus diversus]|uniref:ubiquitin carboxyl-terminal hydrolase 1-like n=1 Tax=Uloborus diversus TaxID=327109 RepID=UPI002409F787|nr:ubiquitin carboxyl-terminal hydrolase 1-like [Uloborus diversus]
MIQLGSFHTELVNNAQLGSPVPKRSRLSLKRATLCPPRNNVKVEPASQSFDSGYATECLENTLSSRTVPPEAVKTESNEVPLTQNNAVSDNLLVSSNSFLGLPNCGNTCFINSVLQVLRFTPNFLMSLHQLIEIGRQSEKLSAFENEIKEIIFFDHLHDLYVAMKRRESMLKNKRREIRVIPKPLKAFILSLREICLLFEEGEQHDAHEFLLTVISSFASSCKTIKKIRDNSSKEKVLDCHVTTLCQEIENNLMEELATIEQVVKQKNILTKRKAVGRSPKSPRLVCEPSVGNVEDLTLGFKGKLRITAKCLECESRREKEDIFYDLGFPFAHDSDTEDTVDLRNCLAQHCHSVMRDENKVNCDECCRKNETKMSSEVISTPPVLLLHLTDSSCSRKLSAFENEIKEIIFFDHLHDLYVAMKRRESMLKNKRREIRVIPKPLKAFILSLREICLLFEEGEQHDAHEFLLTVISSFASSCKTIKKIRDNSSKEKVLDCHVTTLCQEIENNLMEELATIEQVVKQKNILTKRKAVGRSPKSPRLVCEPSVGNVEDLTLGFKGKLRITAKCLECESRREKEDIFYDLGFPFAHDSDTEDTVDLRNCLAQHCHSVMRDENKVNCDECCRKNETKMSSEVISTPPVLLLHLTDSSCSSGFYEKAVTKVAIPLSLQTSENTEIFDCEENQTYSLYAIVVHIGLSTEAGHYVAFIRDNQSESAAVDETKPSGNSHTSDIERCCATTEILNREAVGSSNRWFLFDDENVSLVCTEEGEKTFPYYNYVGVTAAPKMIFYCKN